MNAYSKIRVNDRDICYWETGRGERTLLLLHTLRTQIEYTERIVPLLADHYRIIVPDLPGYGRSSKELTQPYNATLFVETIAALVEKLDLKEITLAGESIGGTIALTLAARMPQRVSRVIAFNPHDSMGSLIGGPIGSVVSYVGQFTEQPFKLEFPALFRLIMQAGFANNKNLSDEFLEKLLTVPSQDERFPFVMKSLMKEAASWPQIADKEYPNIPNSIPTQVIYGDKDWSPSYAAEQNQRRLPKHVRFVTLKNTGHFSFLDNPSGSASIINASSVMQ
jgi:pimeloyl-ACP methyl ester carboxylesterase